MAAVTGLTAEMYQAVVAVVDERVREIRVTREDFDRLAKALSTLAQAQERTEARMGELARAQARTEARVSELAEAQARTEARVSELAEAQARTEERVGRLEQAMERLAEAQARTEDALQELSRQVGALSENVGYGLEDIARVVLPGYLQFRYGLKVSRLERRLFQVDGEAVEFDLYGEGSRDGKPIAVLGEVKSRIYWREVVQFRERLERVRPQMIREAVPLMFGYFIDLTAMEAAQEDILLIASYQPAVDMQAAAMER
ncbi:MAG: hypothetical protein QHJ81_05940 [Anaerolineae bacterium]|nr:hypothetical protein [Anaerolineae bacterium]